MLVLKSAQRAVFVDKLPDAANLAIGALVFGQFLALFVTIIGTMDLIGRRQQRKARNEGR